jgi:hypothetical protein
VDRLAICCNALRVPTLLLVIAIAGHALWQGLSGPRPAAGPSVRAMAVALASPFPDPVGVAGGPAARVDRYQRWLARLKHENRILYRIYLRDFMAENDRLHVPGQWSNVDLNRVWALATHDYHGSGPAPAPPPVSGPCPPCM